MEPLNLEKPSVAVRQALEDLEAIERNPDTYVNMDVWAQPSIGNRCCVCLAGAILYNRYNIQNPDTIHKMLNNENVGPQQPDFDKIKKLASFEHLRQGQVGLFLRDWGIKLNSFGLLYNYVSYSLEAELFKDWLEEVAKYLEESGH